MWLRSLGVHRHDDQRLANLRATWPTPQVFLVSQIAEASLQLPALDVIKRIDRLEFKVRQCHPTLCRTSHCASEHDILVLCCR